MNKRSFLGFLSALPFMGAFRNVATAPSVDLDAVRRYLLPGVWGVFNETPFYADIVVSDGNLIVVAWRKATSWEDDPKSLAFCITREQIVDGYYKAPFLVSLGRLKELMEDQEAANAQTHAHPQ